MRPMYVATSIIVVALVVGAMLYGNSRSQKVAEPELQHVHGFAVAIADPNKLLIATHHGLLQLSEEAALSRVGESMNDFMGFTPHPKDANVFFASGHPPSGGNLGVLRSDDAGVTWQQLSLGLGGPVDFHAMTISPADPNILYGFYRELQRSRDGGKTWEMAKGTVRPLSLIADPVRPNTLYAATKNGVQMSDDQGDTWQSLSPQLEGGAVSAFAIHPEGYALVFSEALGGAGKSMDGGVTWHAVNTPFNAPLLYFAFASANVVFALTGQNEIYKSTDAGDVWFKVK